MTSLCSSWLVAHTLLRVELLSGERYAHMLPPGETTWRVPESIADAYWFIHQQARDAWTFEFDLRPYAEKW